LVEIDTAEKSVKEKAKANLEASNKIMLENRSELNKVRAQRRKLRQQKKAATTKPEK